jgi:hypothetical protein
MMQTANWQLLLCLQGTSRTRGTLAQALVVIAQVLEALLHCPDVTGVLGADASPCCYTLRGPEGSVACCLFLSTALQAGPPVLLLVQDICMVVERSSIQRCAHMEQQQPHWCCECCDYHEHQRDHKRDDGCVVALQDGGSKGSNTSSPRSTWVQCMVYELHLL